MCHKELKVMTIAGCMGKLPDFSVNSVIKCHILAVGCIFLVVKRDILSNKMRNVEILN